MSNIPRPPPKGAKKPTGPVSYAFRAQRLGLNLDTVPIGPPTLFDRANFAYGSATAAKPSSSHNTPVRTGSATSRQSTAAAPATEMKGGTPRGQKSTAAAAYEKESTKQLTTGKYELSKPIRAMKAAEQYRQFLSEDEQRTLVHSKDGDRGEGSVYYLGAPGKFRRSRKKKDPDVVTTKVLVKKPPPPQEGGKPPSPNKQKEKATQQEEQQKKMEVEWHHRDHINFRYEILSKFHVESSGGGTGSTTELESNGAVFLTYDYKTQSTKSVAMLPLTPEEEEEAQAAHNLGRFGAHHLIYTPDERFIYRHHLCTATEADPQLLQIVCASDEFTPASESKVKKASPIPLKKVQRDWGDFLSPYEKEEIAGYEGQIYFLGQAAPKIQAPSPSSATKAAHTATKKKAPAQQDTPSSGESGKEQETPKEDAEEKAPEEKPPGPENNFGFDDQDKMYKTVFGDHMAYRYEVIEELGKGSFGQVLKVRDHSFPNGGKIVALKIIKNEKRFNTQAIVEVRLLEQLRRQKSKYARKEKQDGIVQLLHHFKFRNHVCLVFEVCGMNLFELQKERNYSGFTLDEVKLFSMQILTGMKTIEKENIIHCDLKPENILLQSSANPMDGLRIIDYGSGCFDGEQLYTYIQSRFYRAPEIMLGATPYTSAIDVWSFGTIVCEMVMGYPIFPGENEMDQMQRICQVIPPDDDASFDFLASCSKAGKFFHRNGEVRGGHKDTYSIDEVLFSQCDIDDPVFVDFLSQCLTWDPELRATPSDLLAHEFLREIKTMSPTKRNRYKKKQAQAALAAKSGGEYGSEESFSTTVTSVSVMSSQSQQLA